MSILTVRFIGICCLIDKPITNGDGYTKRVVLPVDNRVQERFDGAHLPYIEMEVVDMPRVSGRFADDTRSYTRDLVTYRRLQLSGDRITIANAVKEQGAKLNVLATYTERVPALTKVTPSFPAKPDPDVVGTPKASRVAAYFDITHGDLHAGPPNMHPTRFSEPTQWPVRRLAQWVELQIPIKDGEGPRIEVESFGRKLGKRTIELREGTARITIGNQLKEDIERNSNDPVDLRREDFRAHWLLYHDLFSGLPSNASRPERTQAIPNGCVVSGHP